MQVIDKLYQVELYQVHLHMDKNGTPTTNVHIIIVMTIPKNK